MTGDIKEKPSAEYRKNRVKWIKRIIVVTCIVLLVVPNLLSIFLMARVSSLQRQMDELAGSIAVGKANDADGDSTGPPNVAQAKEREPETEAPDDTETSDDKAASDRAVSVSDSAVSVSDHAVAVSDGAVAGERKKVYLTFDDGPGTQTAKILDILKRQNVKATFFVTGKEDSYSKKLYQRIVKEGHTLGMHSYSHIYDNIYKSGKAFSEDLNRLYKLLYNATGVYSKWYRFPGGSGTRTMKTPLPELVRVLDRKNVSYVDWNVISPEAMNPKVAKKEMVDGILSDVAKYEVAVILLYDAEDRPMTVKSLPSLIKALEKENYELLPIDRDMVPIRHNQLD